MAATCAPVMTCGIDSRAVLPQSSKTRYLPRAADPNCGRGHRERSCTKSVSTIAEAQFRPVCSEDILRTGSPRDVSRASTVFLRNSFLRESSSQVRISCAAGSTSGSDIDSKWTPSTACRFSAALMNASSPFPLARRRSISLDDRHEFPERVAPFR